MKLPPLEPLALRPLHLSARVRWDIRLDGHALRINARTRPQRFVPLRLLSRITCPTSASWETRALLACMRSGISITFMGTAAAVAGICHGTLRRQSSLHALIAACMDDPDWQAHHDQWQAAMQMHQIRELHQRHRLPGSPQCPNTARNRILSTLHARLGVPAGPLATALDVHTHALVLDLLGRSPATAALLRPPADSVDFPTHFATLLRWRTYGLALRLPSAPGTPGQLAAYLVAKGQPGLARKLDGLVHVFELWLRTCEETATR